jgi:hypothetical protein
MSENGMAFLAARGRPGPSALGVLDMLGAQKPAPDAPPQSVPVEAAGVVAPPAASTQATKRVLISWGPTPGVLMVGIEIAPDWEIEDSWQISADALREMRPILEAVVKVKDLTGEFRRVEPKTAHEKPARATASASGEGLPPAGAKAHRRRGGKDRAADPPVGKRPTAYGPASTGSDEAVDGSAATSLQEANG